MLPSKIRVKSLVWVLLGLIVAFAPGVLAQGGADATLTGIVTDSSGAAIAGAQIVLTEASSGTTRTAKTDPSGFFSFVAVLPGTYNLEAAAKGFGPIKQTGITVHINDQIAIKDLVMKVASTSVSVEVTSAAPEFTPTTSGEQSYTLDASQIQNLNIEGRSAIELLGLVPGAANAGNFNSDRYAAPVEGFVQNASAFSVNGNRFDQISIVSDGSPVVDVQTAGSSAVTPNVDMIQELKVQSAAYSSDQPNGPVVVLTETKSGGSSFHGEGFLTARNNALDATDWRVNHLGLAKPGDSFYYPGFNIGGPVLIPGTNFNKSRSKLFFFFGFEKAVQNVQDPLLDIREAVVPTADMRKGDFTDSAYMSELTASYFATVTPCTGSSNPAFCSAPGTINPNLIDPGGKILLNLLPLPNADPTKTGGFNYISSFVLSQPRDQEILRMDYNINDKNHFFARYNHEGEQVPFPYGFFDNFTPNPYPADQISNSHSNSVTASLATSFTPTLTNELTFTLTRLVYGFDTTNEQNASRSALGYPYPNLYPSGSDLVPNVSFGGGGSAGSIYFPGGFYPNYNSAQQIFAVNENVSKAFSRHLLKVGVYYARQSFNKLTLGNDNASVATEYYNFTTGNEFADLLTGQIGYYAQSSANIMGHMAQQRTDFYAQDLWKAFSRLTLNYGARLDHIGWWYDKQGRMVVFDPAAYNSGAPLEDASGLVSHQTDSGVARSGSQPLGFQFAPSGGFAYDFSGRGNTIIRGGVGTSYYIDPGQNAYSALQSPPNENFTQIYTATTLAEVSTLSTSSLYPTVYGIADQHDHRLPVTYSYNLSLAQIIPAGFRLEASYVGNVSRNLLGYNSQNVVPEGCELNGGPGYPAGGSYAPGTYNDQLCRPFANLQALSTEEHNLSSNYNAAVVTASHPKGPVSFWLTYTFGKTLAYNCENPFDERRCYGPAPFDQTQSLNISFFIPLPNFGTRYFSDNKVANGFLNGWQISGIEQFASGSPLLVSANPQGNEYDGFHNRTINFYGINDASDGYSAPNFDPRVIVGTPDESAVPVIVCNPTANLQSGQYFNAACFQSPALGASSTSPTIGTYRIPYIHGPRYENDELGLFKNFKFNESKSLQFRVQGFNFLNHPLPTFIQYDPNLYLTYDGYGTLPTNTGSAGYASTKIGSRVIQLTAKFFF
jgi:hypothetical protein